MSELAQRPEFADLPDEAGGITTREWMKQFPDDEAMLQFLRLRPELLGKAFANHPNPRFWQDAKLEQDRLEARAWAQEQIDAKNRPERDEPSWGRVELAEIIRGLRDGGVPRQAPTVGRRTDGRAMFYAGKVNGVAGPPVAGKSWTALLVCKQEIEAGNIALYVDLEDDAASVCERLINLGATDADIVARFWYVNPDERFDTAAEAILQRILENGVPTVAVVDSTGEAMALDGIKPNDDDAVVVWFRGLPRMLAKLGAAVIVLDHVPKAPDGRHAPIGSQRKLAAITGAQYMQESVDPFSREVGGWSRLVTAKDRLGHFAKGSVAGELRVEPGEDGAVEMWMAPGRAPLTNDEQADELKQSVCDFLTDHPGANITEIRNGLRRDQGKAKAALDQLVDDGFVERTRGSRGGQNHTLVRVPGFEAAK